MAAATGSGPNVTGDEETGRGGQEHGTSGAAQVEGQHPNPPAKPTARPAPRTPAKKSKGASGDVSLAKLVKADVKPYIVATEQPIPLDLLHLDSQQQHGQIRPLRAEEVDRKAAGMVENPPQSRLHVVVWERDPEGVSPCFLLRRFFMNVILCASAQTI